MGMPEVWPHVEGCEIWCLGVTPCGAAGAAKGTEAELEYPGTTSPGGNTAQPRATDITTNAEPTIGKA